MQPELVNEDVLRMTSPSGIVISAIHDLNIAAAYCDKIYVLKDGVLEGYGTPQEVLTSELIKRIYQVDSEVVNDSRGKMHILFL